jgi:isoamylase
MAAGPPCFAKAWSDVMNEWFAAEGSPSPLGLTWVEEEQAFNFALYSRHASAVTLLLYAPGDPVQPLFTHRFDPLVNKSGRVWHSRLKAASIAGAAFYAYSVGGSNQPGDGNRFDDQKILFDPYSRGIFRPPNFSRASACQPGSNAGRAPLGVLAPPDAFDWSGDVSPVHTHDTVIYETHVRGFTARPNSGVAEDKRGTYVGLVEKIPYLKDLGITAVELLPVFQQDSQEGSYWGYMPLSYFSPNHSYAISASYESALDEFRGMVKALHAAGIEVILDVVFNHTTEGDENGPTYSYRGIDNGTYYLLEPDMMHYRNDTGTGNTLRCPNPCVRRLILDSLLYWKREMHVDGFRFDLAAIFTRNDDGSVNLDDPPVISEISGVPALQQSRLIAEAWDLASYELGRAFPGICWLQWNGKYRDDLRSFLKGEEAVVPAVMTRLYGSDDLFPDDPADAYHPYQSVNFITCHDGFCLYDLVSYNQKHNQANGENNADGTDNNLSWNCGWEGDSGVPADVMALRRRQVKNFCSLLMLSNGTPMFVAGDEFLNTQQGNNNPYNQDNEITWLDWDLLEKNRDVYRFFKTMIAFRKVHPSLGRSRFWRGDVRWYGIGAAVDLSHGSHALAFCLHGASQNDNDLYVMVNAFWEPLQFVIQEGSSDVWFRVVDTSMDSPDDIREAGNEAPLASMTYDVGPRSVVLLLRK